MKFVFDPKDSSSSSSEAKGMTNQKSVAPPPMDGNLMGPDLISALKPLAIAKHLIHLWSTPVAPSSPPPPGKSQALRLISISNSSYAEKARWALDLAQADKANPYYYTEDVHPPAFHCMFSLPATNNTQSRTPVVVLDEKGSTTTTPPVLSSDEIVRTFCPHLYPPTIAQEIVALEHDLGERLGATARSIYYCHNMMPPHGQGKKYYTAVVKLCTPGTTPIERFLFTNMLDKGVDKGISECLQLTPERNAVAEKVLRETFAELSAIVLKHKLLDNLNRHWMDTATQSYGFTAADLCIAVFVQNMCGDVPALEGWAVNNISDDDMPDALVALRREMRQTPIAAYARRIYQQYRPVGPDGRIVFRPARRGTNPLRSLAVWSLVAATVAVGVAVWRQGKE